MWSRLLLSLFLWLSTNVAATTDYFVQHASWANSNESGNGFLLELVKENATLANNCLLLALYYPSTATLSSITETNAGTPNTWSVTPIGTATDSGNGVTVSLFTVFGANAGATAFTINFSAAVAGFSAKFWEIRNIATSSALDVTAVAQSITLSSAAVNVVNSGEITTATDGDLIFQIGWNSDNGPGSGGGSGHNNGLVLLTKQNPGFQFVDTDLNYGFFSQFWIQSKASGVNPGVATTQSAYPSTWESITIALKTGAFGTAPSATDQRIFGMMQTIINGNGTTNGNYVPVQCPTVGNQLVVCCDDPFSSIALAGVSGNISGPWNAISSSGADAQALYKTSALAGDTELLWFQVNDTAGHGYAFIVIYDTVNGGAFDTSQHNDSSTTFGPGNSTPTVSFTPITGAGRVYNVVGIPTGPAAGLTSPAAGSFLSPTYTGQTDTSGLTNGDMHSTYKFTSNAAQTWQFNNSVSTNGYDMLNVSFSLGPIITTPPTNQYAAPGQSVTFSVSATASSGSLSYQWYRIAPGNPPYSAGTAVAGATSSSYTFTPNFPADYGAMWYCAVTDSNATVNSGQPAQVIFQTEQLAKRSSVDYLPRDEGSFNNDLIVKRWF